MFCQLFVYFFSATILTFASVVFMWGVRINTPSIALRSPVKQLFLPAGRVGAGTGRLTWTRQLWWAAQFCLMDRLLKTGLSVSNPWEFLRENLGLIGNVQYLLIFLHTRAMFIYNIFPSTATLSYFFRQPLNGKSWQKNDHLDSSTFPSTWVSCFRYPKEAIVL